MFDPYPRSPVRPGNSNSVFAPLVDGAPPLHNAVMYHDPDSIPASDSEVEIDVAIDSGNDEVCDAEVERLTGSAIISSPNHSPESPVHYPHIPSHEHQHSRSPSRKHYGFLDHVSSGRISDPSLQYSEQDSDEHSQLVPREDSMRERADTCPDTISHLGRALYSLSRTLEQESRPSYEALPVDDSSDVDLPSSRTSPPPKANDRYNDNTDTKNDSNMDSDSAKTGDTQQESKLIPNKTERGYSEDEDMMPPNTFLVDETKPLHPSLCKEDDKLAGYPIGISPFGFIRRGRSKSLDIEAFDAGHRAVLRSCNELV